MKLRQAIKICNRISMCNLVCNNKVEVIVVTGVKGTPYTYEQFRKAMLRINKAFNIQYR